MLLSFTVASSVGFICSGSISRSGKNVLYDSVEIEQ